MRCAIVILYNGRAKRLSVLKVIFDNLDVLNSMGDRARDEARAGGVDSYYIDHGRAGVILVEHPGGKIEVAPDEARPSRKRLAG